MVTSAPGTSSSKDILAVLVDLGKLSLEKSEEVRMKAASLGKKAEEILKEEKQVDEEGLVEAKAVMMGIPYFKETQLSRMSPIMMQNSGEIIGPPAHAPYKSDPQRTADNVPDYYIKNLTSLSMLVKLKMNFKIFLLMEA